MSTRNDNLSRFSRSLWLTFGLFIVFGVVFGIYVHFEKEIDRAHEIRQKSFLLADELRQSSDDLTRMVRSYVITGDPVYKQHFQEILDIRDGKKPRPVEYQDIYWDLVMADDRRPRQFGPPAALLDLMRQAQFTDQEFAMLAQAKANSDALTRTEFAAMSLVESSAPATEDVRFKASQMLHDATYHQAKYAIMRPISEFYRMMDQRTLDAVHAAEDMAVVVRLAVILLGLQSVYMISRVYRTLLNTLGGSLEELYARIARLGSGDFSSVIPIGKGSENSVMAWLSETQIKLSLIETERREMQTANQRMAKLYAALSQCNQTIVRSSGQEELFEKICRGVVNFGGMAMAWIGSIDEQSQLIKPVACFGCGADYLDNIQISLDEKIAIGRGPSGIALREDRPYWSQDFRNDPATLPWRERAEKFGWAASASLPLHRNGKAVGIFNLYAHEVNAFDETTQNLLIEMAIDIDYAINNYEHERQREHAEAALAASHGLLKAIIDTAPMRIFWKDKDLRYLGCNPAFAKDAGESNPADLIGKDDYQLAWREQADSYRTDDLLIMASGEPKLFYEEPQTTPDGRTILLRASKVPLQNEARETIGILGVYEDITEQKQADERIHYLANFDPLTGLPNRARLNDHLKYALSLAKRSTGHLALMFLDLDHFKDINDTLGHSVGDKLLIELAQRLRKVLREEDTVSRLGGDEFILLLPGIDTRGAAIVAQKILDALIQSYRIGHYNLTLTASIGIALYPNDGLDLETLSKSADTAMYRAKQEGRQGYRFFTPEMQASSERNLQLVNALRHALELEQLFVLYQPQVSLRDGRIIGAEALLRWRHPELGMVAPGEFISVAEDCGLILPIGEWVLRRAVQQAKQWLNDGFSPLIMAVNLSVVQFRHPDLPDLITRILNEEGLPANYLELELTESVAMHSPQAAIATMNNLHERGVKMSIDDFGAGYSSLSYLKKFKVYKLKIDQSFVRDISTDAEDKAIVSAVISLAESLGLKTIAEGVETAEQLAYLQDQGCDEVQGYLFSKPLAAEQFAELLMRGVCEKPV
ncbi:MAG: EAL domain-containing protein [Methylomonas sp.]|jgi:diguanylate cyclase (GGDEF)-like protein/PAS domain S-box-containing protein